MSVHLPFNMAFTLRTLLRLVFFTVAPITAAALLWAALFQLVLEPFQYFSNGSGVWVALSFNIVSGIFSTVSAIISFRHMGAKLICLKRLPKKFSPNFLSMFCTIAACECEFYYIELNTCDPLYFVFSDILTDKDMIADPLYTSRQTS